MHHPSLLRLRAALVLAFVAVLALSACSRREAADTPAAGGAGASAAGTPAAELRLGYFANVTHAPALEGVANGLPREGARYDDVQRRRCSTPARPQSSAVRPVASMPGSSAPTRRSTGS